MAKKVLAFFDGSSTGHGNTKYPWDMWADGNIWEVTMGLDFDCKPASFRGVLYSHAKRSGLKIQIQTLTRMGKVRFRFYNPLVEGDLTDKSGKPEIDEVTVQFVPAPDVTNTTSTEMKCFGDGLT